MKKILCIVIGFMFVAQTTFASPVGDTDIFFQDDIMSQRVVLPPPILQTFLFLNPLSEPFVKIIRTFLV